MDNSYNLSCDSAGQLFPSSVICGAALITSQVFMGLFTAVVLRLGHYVCVSLLTVASVFLLPTVPPLTNVWPLKIGSLSNDDRDRKKATGLISNTTLYVHHAFLYISLLLLHHYDVKVPKFTFCQGQEQKTTTVIFFS